MEVCHRWRGGAVRPTRFSTCHSGRCATAQPLGEETTNSEQSPPLGSCCPDLLAQGRGSLWYLPTCWLPYSTFLSRSSVLVMPQLFTLIFHLPLASLPFPLLHCHLPEAVRLATSHPSTAALFSCQGDLPEEDDFPR